MPVVGFLTSLGRNERHNLRDAFRHGLDEAGYLEGKNVAVHCRQGIGRSGLIAAGLLTTSGIPPDEAIQIVSTARRLAVPETMDQRLWVEQLPTNPSVVIR